MRQRSAQILSFGNLIARILGIHAGGNEIKRWYQKKCANGLTVVSIKAVAHKLARAC